MGNRFGWHFNDWPLQLKLNFVALMVFVPTMLAGTSYFFYQTYWMEVKNGLSGLMNFVDAKQQSVIGFIGRNEKLARQLADLTAASDTDVVRRHFGVVVASDVYDLAQHPFKDEITSGKRKVATWKTYHSIDWVQNGIITASSDPAREGQPWNRQLDLKPGYSDVYRDGEKLVLTFGSATPDGGMVYVNADGNILTLIVSGELGNMEGGMGAFYGAGISKSMDYYIVNKDNVLITEAPNHPGSLLNMKGSEHPWKLSRQEAGVVCSQNGTYKTNARCTTGCREAMGFYIDHKGESMLGVSMPFYDSGWTIVVEQAEDELLGPLWHVLQLVMTFATLLLAASIILFVRMAQKHIVSPLTRLTTAIHKTSEGHGKLDASIRYDTGYGDEVGAISRAFDDLQDKLRTTSVSRTFFFQIMENIGRALFVTDNEGFITLVNGAAEELTGYGRESMIGMPMGLLLPIANTPLEEYRLDCECIDSTGTIIPVSCTRTPIAEGEVFVLGDLRERLEAQAQLRLAAKVIENAAQGVIVTDANSIIIDVNPAFSECTGYAREEALGKTPALLRSGKHDKAFYQILWDSIKSEGHWQGEIWNRRKNGDFYPEWLSIAAVLDLKGNPTHYVALFYDITEKKAQEQRIEFIAFHDALTGLPNRALLNERLSQALLRSERQEDSVALFFLDLDRFKLINDTLGHAAGDELLKTVSQRLCACVRATDTVCRQGGDEFILVITDVKDGSSPGKLAEKILEQLSVPVQLGNETISTSFSIGIALYPEDASDPETLFKHADEAMYHSKQAGRNTYRYYNESMNSASKQVMQVENGLRNALENNELLLYYQPQFNISSGKIIGAEALVRWNDPKAGIILPGVFIPVAEESGLILKIGEWVINESFRQIAEWRKNGLADLRIAVNVSAVQFRRCDLGRLVGGALAHHGIPAASVELEITESLLIQDDIKIAEALMNLKKLGVSLSIDDFGTGYSSLSYLRRFNVDCLKIDRSFVRDLGVSDDQDAIVQAIVDMARSLKLHLIAEGVETEDQLALLKRMGCETAQGYLFARPMPAEELFHKFGPEQQPGPV